MKKITTLICLCILVAVFAFMFVFSVCLSRTTVSDYSILKEWPEFSFESFFKGEYISDIMYCFTDTIHDRDRFIDFEAKISDLYGLKEEQEVIVLYPDEEEEDTSAETDSSSVESDIIESSDTGLESSDVSQESTPPESSEVSGDESTPPEKVNPELSGSVTIVGTRALEIYSSNEKMAGRYAEILNEFAAGLDNNVKVYSMVIPKASAYYLELANGYESRIYDNKKDIDKISNTLSDKVVDVNIYNILGLHANEEIYFRTDHHWTPKGAYYATSVFASKAGLGYADLSTYREERRPGYIGTMYKFSNYSTTLLNNPEDFITYYPDAEYTVTYYDRADLTSSPFVHKSGFFFRFGDNARSSWYLSYINGDAYSVKAVSEKCKNGRKLLLVKDSYGNAIAPYLLDSFEEIYIVDGRYYERTIKETIAEYGITDVLFAECTFSAVAGDYQKYLKELCK